MHKKLRISITGPESSGKTTFAFAIARILDIPLVEEFAREWLTARNGEYQKKDLDIMAQTQFELTHFDTSNSLISDTDMLVFDIWSTEKYGSTSPLIQQLVNKQFFHCYFLCKPDIPWEADPLREHPYERARLFETYHLLLEKKSLPYCILEGSLEQRIVAGITYLKQLNLI